MTCTFVPRPSTAPLGTYLSDDGLLSLSYGLFCCPKIVEIIRESCAGKRSILKQALSLPRCFENLDQSAGGYELEPWTSILKVLGQHSFELSNTGDIPSQYLSAVTVWSMQHDPASGHNLFKNFGFVEATPGDRDEFKVWEQTYQDFRDLRADKDISSDRWNCKDCGIQYSLTRWLSQDNMDKDDWVSKHGIKEFSFEEHEEVERQWEEYKREKEAEERRDELLQQRLRQKKEKRQRWTPSYEPRMMARAVERNRDAGSSGAGKQGNQESPSDSQKKTCRFR